MEIWKDIIGHEGYQVSSEGRVRNKATGYIKKQYKNKNGYMYVHMHHAQTHTVHRLVAETFIPNPNNFTDVNHIDECKFNNKVENLEWLSHYDNLHHGTGLSRMGVAHSKTIYQYNLDGTFIRTWKSSYEVERELGFDSSHIRECANGKSKTSYGFIWKHEEVK